MQKYLKVFFSMYHLYGEMILNRDMLYWRKTFLEFSKSVVVDLFSHETVLLNKCIYNRHVNFFLTN